jgi:DNA topoisomerase-1
LPGQQLFQYRDDAGKPRGITSTDVNSYLHDVAGDGFTAKDFRTWAGTVQAARALCQHGCEKAEREIKRAIVAAVREVAETLGNTVAVCRKCYIHPRIFEAYENGKVIHVRGRRARGGLSAEERAVLAML